MLTCFCCDKNRSKVPIIIICLLHDANYFLMCNSILCEADEALMLLSSRTAEWHLGSVLFLKILSLFSLLLGGM